MHIRNTFLLLLIVGIVAEFSTASPKRYLKHALNGEKLIMDAARVKPISYRAPGRRSLFPHYNHLSVDKKSYKAKTKRYHPPGASGRYSNFCKYYKWC